MNRSELFMMAIQNLWARKSRTAFNIFGIVVSCSMLLLVFAGTRGARDGLMNLFGQSDFSKQFAIIRGRATNANSELPKAASSELGAGISQDRKERIGEKLDKAWATKNLPAVQISLEKLDELRGLKQIASILPRQDLRGQLTIGDQQIAARATCFSTETSGLGARIVAGSAPESESSGGKIWIDEYRAWRLGFKTDQQLEELIGTKVKLRFNVAAATLSPKLQRLAPIFGARGISETEQIADAFRNLFAEADQTNLSDIEKEAIRQVATRMGLDTPKPTTEPADDVGQFVYREFEIAGVVKPRDTTATALFRIARANSGSDLLIDWRDYHAIDLATYPNRVYYYSLASVEDSADLRAAVNLVESEGFETRSALEILEKAESELGKVRLIVAAIALVILLIASVGIMNTMIIAVMERTPEFGIMKAIGASDSDIRWLMLIEAALTGILGALVSLAAARLVDPVITGFARQYIETRIRDDFDFAVFIYSFSDALIVAAIAIAICMLASLLPSHRAAKLDPVVAMK
jgi:putative ABC transport system permease protein